jgi:hypothetical protein
MDERRVNFSMLSASAGGLDLERLSLSVAEVVRRYTDLRGKPPAVLVLVVSPLVEDVSVVLANTALAAVPGLCTVTAKMAESALWKMQAAATGPQPPQTVN